MVQNLEIEVVHDKKTPLKVEKLVIDVRYDKINSLIGQKFGN